MFQDLFVIYVAAETRDRQGELKPTAADESRLSSRIINAQGFTTPSHGKIAKFQHSNLNSI